MLGFCFVFVFSLFGFFWIECVCDFVLVLLFFVYWVISVVFLYLVYVCAVRFLCSFIVLCDLFLGFLCCISVLLVWGVLVLVLSLDCVFCLVCLGLFVVFFFRFVSFLLFVCFFVLIFSVSVISCFFLCVYFAIVGWGSVWVCKFLSFLGVGYGLVTFF